MTRPKTQRGFAMLVVIIIAALLAMIAGSLLKVVQGDLVMVGQTRRLFEAREVAEGTVAQVIDDPSFVVNYPDLSDPDLTSDPYPTAGNFFLSGRDDRDFNATVRLLRMGPPLESSLEQTRTLTFEVRSLGSVNGLVNSPGATQAEVVAEVIRMIAYPKGWAPDTRHYR